MSVVSDCSVEAASLSLSKESKHVCEGKADVLLPPHVFYNRVQEFNRDLTIAVISQHAREHFAALDKNTDVNTRATTSSTDDKSRIADELSEIDKMNGFTNFIAGNRYENGLRILEGLAASGLRSVRFAREIPGVREIIANDFDQKAVEFIKKNAEQNGVENLVTASYSDAAMLMYRSRHNTDRFDVIDIDPYGSPAQFLDAAVQSVRDGGVLCITCTDMSVLCGNATETCHAKYGATSLKAKYCHEMALRILLQSIESHANRYQRYILPLLSLSIDFYCRVFVRIKTGMRQVKDSVMKLAMVYHCNGCGSFSLQPLVTRTPTAPETFKYSVATGPPVGPRCTHCNGRYNLGGPIWSAPIHDARFVADVLASAELRRESFGTWQRILGILTLVCEELQDQPLYYVTDDLCRVLHCTALAFLPMRSALLHAGYKVSLAHADKNSIKTNAPAEVIWDIMRCWVRDNPVSADRLADGSAAKNILSKNITLQANFTLHPNANPRSRIKGLLRWQLNPDKDWGPKPRAARDAVKEKRDKGEKKKAKKVAERKSKRKAEVDLKRFPCKKEKLGLCTLGDQCKYLHEGANDSLEGANDSLEGANDSNEGANDSLEGAIDNSEDIPTTD